MTKIHASTHDRGPARDPDLAGERGASRPRAADRGSVTPLVIGMVLCLLLLCAGVTAATSAFLAHQRLQNACDGAAAAAADAVGIGLSPDAAADAAATSVAARAAEDYLRVRSPEVSAAAQASGGTVRLTCRASADVTFGALFGSPTLSQTVQSVGRPLL